MKSKQTVTLRHALTSRLIGLHVQTASPQQQGCLSTHPSQIPHLCHRRCCSIELCGAWVTSPTQAKPVLSLHSKISFFGLHVRYLVSITTCFLSCQYLYLMQTREFHTKLAIQKTKKLKTKLYEVGIDTLKANDKSTIGVEPRKEGRLTKEFVSRRKEFIQSLGSTHKTCFCSAMRRVHDSSNSCLHLILASLDLSASSQGTYWTKDRIVFSLTDTFLELYVYFYIFYLAFPTTDSHHLPDLIPLTL